MKSWRDTLEAMRFLVDGKEVAYLDLPVTGEDYRLCSDLEVGESIEIDSHHIERIK